MQEITLTQPDDWHLHLRDGAAMAAVAGASARCFKRAVVMPNLKPPVSTVEQALAYRARILNALPANSGFEPLMTLYLTDNTAPEEIYRLTESNAQVVAVKYYPAGATTNSDAGVTDLRKVWAVLETMQALQVPLLVHGEVTASSVDIFDRESCFILNVLDPLLNDLPGLRVVLEHITTQQAVDYVLAGEERLAATITVHHLMMNRNALFQGGMNPHHYCLPVLKRESHRQALLHAVSTGNPRFFLGTDSAPHAEQAKLSACGCAGIYSAPVALELYAEVFEEIGALDKLEAFAAFHGADFYRLPRNQNKITLRKEAQQVPASFAFGEQRVIPLRAGESVSWRLHE